MGNSDWIVALVAFAAIYRSGLDYRFEVVAILFTWPAQIIAGVLLATGITRGAAAFGGRVADG